MKRIAMTVAVLLSLSAVRADAGSPPNVVATFLPVHSLVAGVMEGVGTPGILVRGGVSPHVYSMRPSDIRMLNEADLIFWIGRDFETFLENIVKDRGRKGGAIELAKAPGVHLLDVRRGGTWEAHDHGDDHGHGRDEKAHSHGDAHGHGHGHGDRHAHGDGHSHGERHAQERRHGDGHRHDHGHAQEHMHDHDHRHAAHDMHIWLDPANAAAMVTAIETALKATDPANAARYQANATKLRKEIETLDVELRRDLAPVTDRPFVVFHDAYQYFEKRYGLNGVGSVTVSPEVQPGAKRLYEIRNKITSLGAVCVFSEPPFQPATVETLLRGTNAKTGMLDPEGIDMKPGRDAYFTLMRNLAISLNGCLKPSA